MNIEERWLLVEKYGGVKTANFYTDCERLKGGEPLAYLIGTAPFLNTIICLDSHPLIPRSETEFWVEQAIKTIRACEKPVPRVLDVCAGSGCIGVAIAANVADAHVDFVELEVEHHATIRKNLSQNRIDASRFRIFAGDVFECITDRYDFILSNPPYINPALNRVSQSVRDHEPALALYGGKGGIAIITKLIAGAPARVCTPGELWIEHEPEQAPIISRLGKEVGFTTHTHLDQYNTLRYSRMVL